MTENSAARIKVRRAGVSSGLHQTLVTLSRYVVILGYAVKRLAARTFLYAVQTVHTVLSRACDSATSLGLQWVFAHLLLLKKGFINCYQTYSKVHGNWLFASAKWGNSTSSEKAVRNWAYHTSQRPRGFCQRSLAKNVRGQSSPLRASCITFLGNTRRATASRTNVHNQLKVKAEMLKGKTVS